MSKRTQTERPTAKQAPENGAPEIQPTVKACGGCAYAQYDTENRTHRCHRYPPYIKWPHQDMCIWPAVRPTDVCGEWKESMV